MGTILSAAGLASFATLETVLLRNGRSISNIIPDCTIEERHKDELEITQSPVEQGSPIADHAYSKPCELVMRVGWSDSSSLAALAQNAIAGTSLTVSILDVYQQLLDLQATLQPFSIVTGKRTYDNMLLRSLQVVTNRESENALMVEALFQEVILVSTQVQSLSSLGTVANQANPQNTAPPTSTGSNQLGAANSTAAATIGGL